MAKRKADQDATGQPAQRSEPAGPSPDFPVHEHIGRQLRNIFDEIVTQPVPDKLRRLLDELELKQATKKDE